MRLVSLWWELPPRLDSNISIYLRTECNSFLYFKMDNSFMDSIEIFYRIEITG